MAWARWIAAGLALLLAAASAGRLRALPPDRPTVVVAEFDGIIHPIAAEYLTGVARRRRHLERRAGRHRPAHAGRTARSTRTIVSRIITSRAPVVVFVAPSGSRAASAGFVLTIAADVAAMAPGTHIGAAHPVSGGGQKMDETTGEEGGLGCRGVRALACRGARTATSLLAEQAVLESRAFTDGEAADAHRRRSSTSSRRDVRDLLRQLDGRTIKRFDGRPVDRCTPRDARSAARRDVTAPAVSRRDRASADCLPAADARHARPDRRAVEPGHAFSRAWPGALSLLLAFFAFQVLPVNTHGPAADCVWHRRCSSSS